MVRPGMRSRSSLVDHGDLVIRDPDVWFVVFPGRDGQRYTQYRFSAVSDGYWGSSGR